MTMFALQRDRRSASPDDFIEQLTELLGYLNGDLAAEHPFSRLAATLPGLPERPEPWLLGSSPQSAVWAGQLGLRYSFADFINAKGAEIADLYRREFRETAELPSPTIAVATWAICAETQEEADRLASSSRMTLRLLNQGRLIPVPPVETAVRFLASQPESADPEAAPPPGDHRRSGHRGGGPRGGGPRLRCRRGDARHDHARSRGPAALV